jgi:hypothetical protein
VLAAPAEDAAAGGAAGRRGASALRAGRAHRLGAGDPGPDAFLGVEHGVVLNANDAREIARKEATIYLEQAPHDQANLRRLGFTDADLADGGSDRLIDALVAFGSEGTAKRVRAHLDAGADHGCVWVLTGDNRLPRAEWRALAGALR